MAPKAKRAASPGPKAKAKAKGKAAEAPPPDPKALALKEGEEMFEKYEDGGVVKLKGFAECIRAMNIKKCALWDERQEGPTIKDFWKSSGGQSKKELSKEEFANWYVTFLEAVEAAVNAREAAETQKEEEKKKEAADKAAVYDGTGIWRIPLTLLTEAIDEAYKRGKTPLFIDSTENHPVESYYTYSAGCILECKKMVMDMAKGAKETDKATAVKDVLEQSCKSFWASHCFKYGSTVVFRMANSAADIKNTFNSEVFPTHALLNANEVNKILGDTQAENFKGSPFFKMCQTDDQRNEHTLGGVHEKFRVVVITQFQEEDYEGFLKDMFPLELCQPIAPFVK